ncbi:hypothetical protein D9K79_05310 [Acinetobacter cumulans]|uniref:Bacteriophage abortive infection AbiH n=1 Tax=Acinetobacter cumulans TaxID=2136182 RepID=A0ABX9U827_9GAMM|nr:AbiH family protein [Acinetobacter cumulans]RLL48614.1 hypothetical protein D9K79_05310 [Acinetobacter cumulans]
MNILIVGNGFDLSHYLPTKYDHFMDAMNAIENWDEVKGDMGFDDLFGGKYWHKDEETSEEWQNSFFQHTKAMYRTDEIKISVDQIKVLKEQLKDNVWYQYFSDHVREVKTWIDFENKIKNALYEISIFFLAVENVAKKNSQFSSVITHDEKVNNSVLINKHTSSVLDLLGILDCTFYKWLDGNLEQCSCNDEWINTRYKVKEKFIQENKLYKKIKFEAVENHLQSNINNFSQLFNEYLLLIESLFSKKIPSMKSDLKILKMSKIDKVFSFNYTSTFEHLYGTVGVDFLHGKISKNKEEVNIVLGVSELDKHSLMKYGFYGFLKYHQKLLNDTDYLFLDDSTELVQEIFSSSDYLDLGTNFNFYIWGHSLDSSDEQYIKELFSLNTDVDQNVRVIVLYFNKQAKFDLLANLLDILGQEKIERWMKKGWLKFEENPDIAKLNGIEPVDLPKISAS